MIGAKSVREAQHPRIPAPGPPPRCARAAARTQGEAFGPRQAGNYQGVPMAEAVIWEFTGVSEAGYAAVSEPLGIDVQTGHGDWPARRLSHAVGTTDGRAFHRSQSSSSPAHLPP